MPPPDGGLFSLPLHPSLPDAEQSAALAGDRPVSCPCHFRTAHRNRHTRVCPLLGLLPWQRPWPPICGMASSGLPAMNCSDLFNPPVQGSVPATPETPMTQGAFLPPRNPRPTLRGLDAVKRAH